MMSKYTKGPWCHNNGIVREFNGEPVASCNIFSFASKTRKRTKREDHANARLIAVAPEMLEYLKNIQEIAVITMYYDECTTSLKELIAKAEGKDGQE